MSRPVYYDTREADLAAMKFQEIEYVDYEKIKDLPNHPEKLLIDVRDYKKVQRTGAIPTSINIPLIIINQMLKPDGNSRYFKQIYGRPKPDRDTYIITTSHCGKISEYAVEQLHSLGYKNVYNYEGSWLDWDQHQSHPIKTRKEIPKRVCNRHQEKG